MRAKRWHPAVVLPGERPAPVPRSPIPAQPLAGLDPAQRAALPNLLVIGAAKCGTSALHSYLAGHPDICMSANKEVKLFGSRGWLHGLPGYAARFDAGRPVRGETSPTYSMDPYVPGVPEQIAAVLPAARFVYLVGEPLRRVVAHWGEHRALTYERRSLEEALADAGEPDNPYVAASRYGHQLQRYIEVFGPERILVVDQRDLRERRRETLREIFGFAGVDPRHWSPAYMAEPNAAADKFEPNALGRSIIDRTWLPLAVRRRAMGRKLTAGPIRRVELTPALRERLERILGPDIAHFRALTGRSFGHWPI
jgi:hypothetical protein